VDEEECGECSVSSVVWKHVRDFLRVWLALSCAVHFEFPSHRQRLTRPQSMMVTRAIAFAARSCHFCVAPCGATELLPFDLPLNIP